MKLKYPLCIFIFILQACQRDNSLYLSVLNEINENTKYMLYDSFNYEKTPPVQKGIIGKDFLNCLTHAKMEFFPGKTSNRYVLELFGNNGKMFYYALRVTERKIYTVQRINVKTKYSYIEGKLNKIECSLDDLISDP